MLVFFHTIVKQDTLYCLLCNSFLGNQSDKKLLGSRSKHVKMWRSLSGHTKKLQFKFELPLTISQQIGKEETYKNV